MAQETPRRADQHAHNHRLLQKARDEANKRDGYSTSQYRERINDAFRRHIDPKHDLYSWQQDAAEARFLHDEYTPDFLEREQAAFREISDVCMLLFCVLTRRVDIPSYTGPERPLSITEPPSY